MYAQYTAIYLMIRRKIRELTDYLESIDKWHDQATDPLDRMHFRHMRDLYVAKIATLRDIRSEIILIQGDDNLD